jgi:hypothetical protein
MKLISLLDLLATPPAPAAAPRRDMLRHLGRAVGAALPLALGVTAPVLAAPATSYDSVLQLLLSERLQLALYTQALAAAGLIPSDQTADFTRLRSQQSQHIGFFTQALQNAGALVPATPIFDFSGRKGVAGNPVLFPNSLTDYDQFLALAQQLEDLGVRLYKTHAFSTPSDVGLQQAILRMHSVEGQHSAHVRILRRARGAAVQPWPSTDNDPIVRTGDALKLTLAATGGEEMFTQPLSMTTNVPFSDLLLIRDNTAIHDPSLPEAFDEPVATGVAQAALELFF